MKDCFIFSQKLSPVMFDKSDYEEEEEEDEEEEESLSERKRQTSDWDEAGEEEHLEEEQEDEDRGKNYVSPFRVGRHIVFPQASVCLSQILSAL